MSELVLSFPADHEDRVQRALDGAGVTGYTVERGGAQAWASLGVSIPIGQAVAAMEAIKRAGRNIVVGDRPP